jgi:general L-amino acid transport system permease protein
MMDEHAERFGYPAMEPPPRLTTGPVAWLRENLFSGWLNGALTVFLAVVLGYFAMGALRWATQEANWGVITTNMRVILWGRYPQEELWRPVASVILVLVLAALSWIVWRSAALGRFRSWMIGAWLLSPFLINILLGGLELPTLRTITNNIGYFLFRPDLLPVLEATWRGPAALGIIAVLAGATWAIESRRVPRLLALLAGGVFLGLNLPAAGLTIEGPAGLPIPQLLIVGAAAVGGWLAGRAVGKTAAAFAGARRLLTGLWVVALGAVVLILTDFEVGRPEFDPQHVLSQVQPSLWSGMMLTIILSALAILLSFPLGVLLALGRMSRLPVIRVSCVTIIEVVRGVPLITILFMAQVMLPMFLPIDLTIDRVARAIAGLTIFTAAYLAEVVRGGLQSVPHEQLQAARALGLSEFLVTALILLPQALRLVVPAIMGQFVSIFKDTSLIAIVGLLELLGILSSITKQREFIGTVREVYLFAAVFYFVIAYAMSVASRRVEKQLGLGTR